tara:strand:+ start:126 stop:491 length:366 start_codon:yes stop_codon:yes gene_type:complete
LAIEDEMMMKETMTEEVGRPTPPPAPPVQPTPAPPTINEAMGVETAEAMKQPDQRIQIVLMSRLQSMDPAELKELDRAIDSKTARVLIKLLPELEILINEIMNRGMGGNQPSEMGALSGMM